MRKLLVALILSVILSMTFATPAFADDGKGNMPGNADDLEPWRGLKNALWHKAWGVVMSGGNAVFNAWGAVYRLHDVIAGQPPAKPGWASGPK